jgi:hypothetical protein
MTIVSGCAFSTAAMSASLPDGGSTIRLPLRNVARSVTRKASRDEHRLHTADAPRIRRASAIDASWTWCQVQVSVAPMTGGAAEVRRVGDQRRSEKLLLHRRAAQRCGPLEAARPGPCREPAGSGPEPFSGKIDRRSPLAEASGSALPGRRSRGSIQVAAICALMPRLRFWIQPL